MHAPQRPTASSVKTLLRGSRLVISAFLLGATIGPTLIAQNPPAPAPAAPVDGGRPLKKFEERSQITLVEVPVNVVDRNGDPVRGLTADDFELAQDGRAQKIDSFETIDLATINPRRAQVERQVSSLPTSSRRRFLLLFDFTFSNPNAVIRAREAARDLILKDLHPTDLAAVATFSLEQGPRLLVTFTSDRGQLARAIDTLGFSQLIQRGHIDPLRFFYDTPDDFNPNEELGPSDGGSRAELDQMISEHLISIALDREKAQKTYQRSRITAWSRSLGDLATSMAALNGRKHVVLFSAGFDGSLVFGRDASRQNDEAESDQRLIQRGQFWLVDQDNTFGNSALQNDLAEMLEKFRRADCQIQAVDLGGLRTDTSAAGVDRNTEASRVRDRIDSLFYVANATGGNLFEQTNNLRTKLGDLLDRSSVTYVLSFYPADLRSDSAFHRLKVKLKDNPGGYKLTHRAGFYAPKEFQDLHPLEKSLLASEALTSTAPRQEIEVAMLTAPFRADEAKAYVPVVVEIDGKSLLAGHDDPKLGVEIYIYASTLQGQMRDFRTQLVNVDLAKQRNLVEKRGIKYYGHFDLQSGEYTIRVLVRNSQNGRTSVSSQTLTIPQYTANLPELLPPFFVEQASDWLLIRERLPVDAQEAFVYPFTLKGEPFIPAVLPRLQAGVASRLCLVTQNFGNGPLQVKATVVGSEGVAHGAGQLALIERTAAASAGGAEKLLATFDPQTLQSGSYTLQLAVKNTENGNLRTTSIPFVID